MQRARRLLLMVVQEVGGGGVVAGVDAGHAGSCEEGVVRCHVGDGFGVARGGLAQEGAHQAAGEADAAVLGMDDDAADGAQVAVEVDPAPVGRDFAELEGALAGGAVEGGVGEDADGDGVARPGGGDVVDGEHEGVGGGVMAGVMEAREAAVVGGGGDAEGEGAGEGTDPDA